MPEFTARPAAPDSLPLDFATMADTAQHLIDAGGQMSAAGLDTGTLAMRGHLALLIPEAEDRLGRLAGAGAEEARQRLAAGPDVLGPLRYARCLARSVIALCTLLADEGKRDA
ncbi:DUF6415 family natural product biosynthesis protein [Streptomyces sp. NPDC002018]|uniref:DUF6415 family natural product biosynthesis protein n=1 Tax=Streptomyces sp. NPDC002018 TaxID=3364629 RepID=UPI0036814FCE